MCENKSIHPKDFALESVLRPVTESGIKFVINDGIHKIDYDFLKQ